MIVSIEYWTQAQNAELSVWQEITSSLARTIEELADLAAFVDFTSGHGLGPRHRVIELGIGPLGIGWGALSNSRSVIGIDPLPRLEVNTELPEINSMIAGLQGRTDYVRGDATQQLPYAAGGFAVVVCDNVIDHTQGPNDILREARRLVADDGCLLFSVNVFSRVGVTKWRQVTRRRRPSSTNVVCHPHSYTEAEAKQVLMSNGWALLAETKVSKLKRFVGRAYRWRAVAEPA